MLYRFDHPHKGSYRDIACIVGGKGASLWMMASQLGLPVPLGFTLGIEACLAWQKTGWSDALEQALRAGLARLETDTGQTFGGGDNPLLVSVRSGAAASMPGMMDTILNVGWTQQSGFALATRGGKDFGQDIEKRFLTQYARIVLGNETEGDTQSLREALTAAPKLVDLDDPIEQIRNCIQAVFASWHSPRAKAYRQHEGQSGDGGTAVTIQAMVFGNLSPNSCTGVLFTRDPATGASGHTGEVLFQAQGEDVVSGTHVTQPLSRLSQRLPHVAEQLAQAAQRIEHYYKDMADIEFTVQDGALFILQARVGKRTPQAAAHLAIAFCNDANYGLTKKDALARLPEGLLEGTLSLSHADANAKLLTRGIAASPGVATGRLVFDPDRAVDLADDGWSIILARAQTCPSDVHGMGVSAGIVTKLGGMMSHAAVVARGWGIPAVVGATDIELDAGSLRVGGHVFHQGDVISIDGTTGAVYAGDVARYERGDANLDILCQWAADLALDPPRDSEKPHQSSPQLEDT